VSGPTIRSRGAIAQLGERSVCIRKVAGSNPAGSTSDRSKERAWAEHPNRTPTHGLRFAPILPGVSEESFEAVRGVRIVLRPLDQDAARHRTVDERLSARLPALYPLTAAAFAHLSPKLRLRRWLVARVITRAYAAANRHDFDLLLHTHARGYEYRPSRDLMPPDMEPVFRGDAGYLKLWRYWLDAFEDIRWDPEEILDFGDTLLVTTRQSGHGSGSGLRVSEPVFQLFTLRRGRVLRQDDFLDRSEALEAAARGREVAARA
jgi:ketosteroid isomerase-like protein